MNILSNRIAVIFSLFVVILLFSCQEDIQPIENPSDFVKERREDLGDIIQVAIAQHPDVFPVIPNIPPYDTTVYWYTQSLYDQATNALRLDNLSSDDDRWDFDRPWRVTILDMEDKNAFAVPGGHLYISTGFLKSLETEHELFYILAFEASLINEKTLLNRLISEHNTIKLSNIGKRIPNDDGTDAFTLAQTLSNLLFDGSEVMENDTKTANLICESSIFNRKGILNILDRLENDSTFKWLETRYYNSSTRRDFVDFALNAEGDCGNFIQNGNYNRYILDVLD